MDRRLDRGLATRRQIVAKATQLFTEEGYEAVSIEALLRACGISRGALYHHFSSKEAVFTAVLQAVEQRIVDHLAASALDVTNPLDALRAGCAAWLELAESDATVRRVVLTDAPSVIGWAAWRKLDEEYSFGRLRAALSAAAAAGRFEEERVELYAHMLLAMLIEIALLIARSASDTSVVRNGKEAVDLLLTSLLGLKPNANWPTPRRTASRRPDVISA